MKEQLKQNIEKMKAELAKMEAELEKSEKVELEKFNYGINGVGQISDKHYKSEFNANAGMTRATKELAEIASKNMVSRNKLEAYAMQLEPEWRDVFNISYFIYYDLINNMYSVGSHNGVRHIGNVYMSKQTAETICQWLNEGRITLEKE